MIMKKFNFNGNKFSTFQTKFSPVGKVQTLKTEYTHRRIKIMKKIVQLSKRKMRKFNCNWVKSKRQCL